MIPQVGADVEEDLQLFRREFFRNANSRLVWKSLLVFSWWAIIDSFPPGRRASA